MQLDAWLMVMVIMDLAPFVWCLLMTLRFAIMQRQRNSSFEDSTDDGDVSSNDTAHLSLFETMPSTLMETAELLSLTMKKWSPAYQLNEMIMRRVDGCIFGHASCCKFVLRKLWSSYFSKLCFCNQAYFVICYLYFLFFSVLTNVFYHPNSHCFSSLTALS